MIDRSGRVASGGAGLSRPKDLFEELECSRVIRLAEPEHRLPPYFPVPVVARHVDQFAYSLAPRQLPEPYHRPLLDLGIRVAIDGVGDSANGFVTGTLSHPEERVGAHVPVLAA